MKTHPLRDCCGWHSNASAHTQKQNTKRETVGVEKYTQPSGPSRENRLSESELSEPHTKKQPKGREKKRQREREPSSAAVGVLFFLSTLLRTMKRRRRQTPPTLPSRRDPLKARALHTEIFLMLDFFSFPFLASSSFSHSVRFEFDLVK